MRITKFLENKRVTERESEAQRKWEKEKNSAKAWLKIKGGVLSLNSHQDRCPHTKTIGSKRIDKKIQKRWSSKVRNHTIGEEAWGIATRTEVSRSSTKVSIQVSVFDLELVYENSSTLIYDILI